jgi:hypothetical protein
MADTEQTVSVLPSFVSEPEDRRIQGALAMAVGSSLMASGVAIGVAVATTYTLVPAFATAATTPLALMLMGSGLLGLLAAMPLLAIGSILFLYGLNTYKTSKTRPSTLFNSAGPASDHDASTQPEGSSISGGGKSLKQD